MSASIYSLHDCQRQGCEITIRGPAIKQGSRISKSRSAITGKLVCNMLNYPQSRGRWGGGHVSNSEKKGKKKKRKQRDWVKGIAPWGRYERLDRQTDRQKEEQMKTRAVLEHSSESLEQGVQLRSLVWGCSHGRTQEEEQQGTTSETLQSCVMTQLKWHEATPFPISQKKS